MSFPIINAPVDQLSGIVNIDSCYLNEWMKAVYNNTGKQFGIKYGRVTNEVMYAESKEGLSSNDSFTYKYFELTLYEKVDKATGEMAYKLKIKVNPSKIYYKGKNYRNIPKEDFRNILFDFARTFLLNLNDIKLTAPFEPSITICDPTNIVFSEETIKDRVIAANNNLFVPVKNGRGKFLGYETEHNKNDQSYRKFYLPAIKFEEPELNYLRIEKHYQRIHTFTKSTGINTWTDLVSDEGLQKCYDDVARTLDQIIIYDPQLRRSKNYPDWMNQMISQGNNSYFWLNTFSNSASPKALKRRLYKYRILSCEKGAGMHNCLTSEAENTIYKTAKSNHLMNGNIKPLYNNDEIKSNQIINLKKKSIEERMRRVSTSMDEKKLINEKKI